MRNGFYAQIGEKHTDVFSADFKKRKVFYIKRKREDRRSYESNYDNCNNTAFFRSFVNFKIIFKHKLSPKSTYSGSIT